MSELGFYALKDIVRLKDNKDSLLPISRSTWLRGIESGEYPKPVKIAGRNCWRKGDIHKLIEDISGDA
jgi:predicted DNA-binding transcriptional regulator AlpA